MRWLLVVMMLLALSVPVRAAYIPSEPAESQLGLDVQSEDDTNGDGQRNDGQMNDGQTSLDTSADQPSDTASDAPSSEPAMGAGQDVPASSDSE